MLADRTGLKKFVNAVQQKFDRALRQRQSADSPLRALERQIVKAEGEVSNLVNAITMSPDSAALVSALKPKEEALDELRRQRASVIEIRPGTRVLPAPKELEGYLREMLQTLEEDQERGREYLARCMGPVTMVLEGEGPDRFYSADGAFDIAVIGKSSCGGAMHDQTQTLVFSAQIQVHSAR
jgi:hypothetical protein